MGRCCTCTSHGFGTDSQSAFGGPQSRVSPYDRNPPQSRCLLTVSLSLSIIAIPAIGADPHTTWRSTRDGKSHPWLEADLQKEIPSARILLYDHLDLEERKIQKKPLADAAHKSSAEKYSAVQSKLSNHRLHDWTDRFLEAIFRYRDSNVLQQRPLIFLCHSTGGLIIKEALSRKVAVGIPNLAAVCIGISFFATPHHGSNVLSKPAFASAIKDRLKLKWEMSEVLMSELSVQNDNLKFLNHRFASVSLGIKIWNHYESRETDLKVLTTGDIGGENLTTVSMFIVDPSSARMSTSDVSIEGEVPVELNTNHVGTARLADDEKVLYSCIDALEALAKSTDAHVRAAHHALITSIMTDVKVEVHQFYQMEDSNESKSTKVWSERPSLQDLLESGPRACLKRRLSPTPHKESMVNGYFKPKITLDHPTEPNTPAPQLPEISGNPSIVIDSPVSTPRESLERGRPGLGISNSVQNGTAFHDSRLTRLISRNESPSRLLPTSRSLSPNTLRALSTESRPTERTRPPPERTYQLPTQSRDKFIWVHVPYTHQGWVSQVLASISREKKISNLHKKVLSDQIWRNHHNRSRHASSHARFVRSLCKSLLPRGSSNHHHDEMSTPTSAINQAQFALYLPYLHWDTFQRLEQRAQIIRKRGKQSDATPINEDVAHGKSMEHKLIWQYHSSNQPLHCRRTLDQYGYPSLRNTSVRDHDQVLYKQTRTQRAPDESLVKPTSMQHITAILHAARDPGLHASKVKTLKDSHAKVLMVDQLWLWILDDETVVSFAAPKERDEGDAGLHEQGDLRRVIYKDINGDFSRPCDDCFDFAALAVYHAVTALLDQIEDKDLQVFRIFEEYISELTEQQTKSFKEFRDHHRYREIDIQKLPKYVDNRDDLNAVLELRDIDDELGTIEKLLGEQHQCVTDMLNQFEELKTSHNKGHHGYYLLQEVKQIISGYKSHVAAMKKSAHAAQEAFEKLLDMKQKQANIDEAHLAREQTEVAAEQSRSVMIFTIFTIIFLPLSFFASVFGINAREWSGIATNPSLHSILVYMGSISLAVIIIALLVAFNRATRKIVQRAWRWIGAPVTHLLKRMPGRRFYDYLHYTDVERAELIEIDRESQRRRSASRPTRETRESPTWNEDVFKMPEAPKGRSDSRPRRGSHVVWQEDAFTKNE